MSKSFWEGTVYRSINWRGNVLGRKRLKEETVWGGKRLSSINNWQPYVTIKEKSTEEINIEQLPTQNKKQPTKQKPNHQ